MKRASGVLLATMLAGPAFGQSPAGQDPTVLTCGVLKGEASRTGTKSQWSISTPAGTTNETGMLRSGPRFQCVDGAVLLVEFTSSAGHSVLEAYFPEGTTISYGRQQVDRRGGRVILPVQARARIPAPYRGAFDYHCKLNMPADPITPAARADCLP